jgi:hypothetical protein
MVCGKLSYNASAIGSCDGFGVTASGWGLSDSVETSSRSSEAGITPDLPPLVVTKDLALVRPIFGFLHKAAADRIL